MLSILGDLVPYAVPVALSPLPIIAAVMLLLAPAGARGGLAFLIGRFATLAALAFAVSLVAVRLAGPGRAGQRRRLGAHRPRRPADPRRAGALAPAAPRRRSGASRLDALDRGPRPGRRSAARGDRHRGQPQGAGAGHRRRHDHRLRRGARRPGAHAVADLRRPRQPRRRSAAGLGGHRPGRPRRPRRRPRLAGAQQS